MGMISPVAIGRVYVGEEPDDDDIAALAASGFRSIVCVTRSNPPQSGNAGFPDKDHERAAAEAAGLAFLRLPSPGTVTLAMVSAFRELVRVLPRPIYVHCGFGQAAAALALVAEGDLLDDPAATIDVLSTRGIRMPPGLIAEVARLRAAAGGEGSGDMAADVWPGRRPAPGRERKRIPHTARAANAVPRYSQ
jgi:protein tyrosine phosphatase (PTP) superfamily phosphohydrolase (DUF442 family)